MKIFRVPKKEKNWIVAVAIGEKYFDEWFHSAYPLWDEYAKKYSLGLVVFTKNLSELAQNQEKKANWQKLLIGEKFLSSRIPVKNILYLDTDMLISPFAPNIFDSYQEDKISVVSQAQNLYQPLHQTLRRLAFLRHTFLDKRYPLDSALFMKPAEIFKFHKLRPFTNYFCTGLFVFNVKNHSETLQRWYYKYKSKIKTITGGGEEPIFNYELQKWGKLQLLPYEFQALWTFEIAWKYPFLFKLEKKGFHLTRDCIEASLYANHFLHFAGSWHECQMWKIGGFFQTKTKQEELKKFKRYLTMPITGKPKGLIKPTNP